MLLLFTAGIEVISSIKAMLLKTKSKNVSSGGIIEKLKMNFSADSWWFKTKLLWFKKKNFY